MNNRSAKFEQEFDVDYYLASNPDVAAAKLDAVRHYRKHGWKEGRSPAPWFDPAGYRARFPRLIEQGVDPFAHFLQNENVELAKERFRLARDTASIRAEVEKRSKNREIPQIVAPDPQDVALLEPFFDEAYYLSAYPDVREIGDPLLHFVTVGGLEGRDPSPDFSSSYYLKYNDDVRRANVNPLLHHVRYGRLEKGRRMASVEAARISELFDNGPALAEVIEMAALDPMVRLPEGPRQVVIPVESDRALAAAARSVRGDLAGQSYDFVVLVPHIRMSGAARVASIFASTLGAIRGKSRILVVATDKSELEYAHWFADDIAFYDLASVLEPVEQADRPALLCDLLRGVGVRAMVNVNSFLAWTAIEAYGASFKNEFRILTYLFTWDETATGIRVGYPIQRLDSTCHHHDVLMTDNEMLAGYVRDRYAFDKVGGTEVVALHTPVDKSEIERNSARAGDGPLFLWAGRFDRQKRVDLLIGLARANPDATFHVYGKEVLEGQNARPIEFPPNCVRKGTYKSLQEVLATAYDGFVYTAQWDGIPTILLDIAQTGLPIVAPDIGGIGEVVSDDTGWLIERFDDVDAYGRAIREIAADPQGAAVRAERLKTHVARKFSSAGYRDLLGKVLSRHDL